MGLLGVLSDRVLKRSNDGLRMLREIAVREALGRTAKGDAEALERALAESGKTPDDYLDLLELVRKAEDLRAKAGKLPGLEQAALEAAHAVRDHMAETERIMRARSTEIGELRTQVQNCEVSLQDAKKAADQLTILEDEHPEELGAAAVDLDQFTLTSGNTVINENDSAAPRRAVRPEVFLQETHRRCWIMRQACERAIPEYWERVRAWAEANQVGRSSGPCPQRPNPTWAEMVKSGFAATVPHEGEYRPGYEDDQSR